MTPTRAFESILHSTGTSLALGMIAYGQAPSPPPQAPSQVEGPTPEIRAAHPRPEGGLAVEIFGGTESSAVFDLRREWPLEADDDDPADVEAWEDVEALDPAGPAILFGRSWPDLRPGPYVLELRRVRDGLPERRPAAVRPVWIGSLDAWLESWETERKAVRALLAGWKGDGGDADAAALAGFAPARFFSVASELAALHDETERRIIRESSRNRTPAGSSPEAPAGAKGEGAAVPPSSDEEFRRRGDNARLLDTRETLNAGDAAPTGKEGAAAPPPEDPGKPPPRPEQVEGARDRYVRETLGWLLLAAERTAGRLCVLAPRPVPSAGATTSPPQSGTGSAPTAPADVRLRDLGPASASSAFTEWSRLAALAQDILKTEPDLRDPAAASEFTALWEKFPASAGSGTTTTDWPAAAALARVIRLRLKK